MEDIGVLCRMLTPYALFVRHLVPDLLDTSGVNMLPHWKPHSSNQWEHSTIDSSGFCACRASFVVACVFTCRLACSMEGQECVFLLCLCPDYCFISALLAGQFGGSRDFA